MLTGKCKNCGVKLRISERDRGKRAKCPKCHNRFIIPVQEPASQPQNDGGKAGKEVLMVDGKPIDQYSNEQIAALLISRPVAEEQKQGSRSQVGTFSSLFVSRPVAEKQRQHERSQIRAFLSFFIPRYDDVTLFALSFTFILLLSIEKQMRTEVFAAAAKMMKEFNIYIIGFVGLAVFGMLLSMFHVFIKREKEIWEKFLMFVFAVIVSGGSGCYAGMYMLKNAQGWLVVFPIWNIINGILLFILLRAGLGDMELVDYYITDKTVSIKEITASTVLAGILAVLCLYVFRLHWVIVYSICVCYTMNIQSSFRDIFGSQDEG